MIDLEFEKENISTDTDEYSQVINDFIQEKDKLFNILLCRDKTEIENYIYNNIWQDYLKKMLHLRLGLQYRAGLPKIEWRTSLEKDSDKAGPVFRWEWLLNFEWLTLHVFTKQKHKKKLSLKYTDRE